MNRLVGTGMERNCDFEIAPAMAGISENNDAAMGWGCRNFQIAVPFLTPGRGVHDPRQDAPTTRVTHSYAGVSRDLKAT